MPHKTTIRTSVQWNGVPRKPACMPRAKWRTGKTFATHRIQLGVLLSKAMKMPDRNSSGRIVALTIGAAASAFGTTEVTARASALERPRSDGDHHDELQKRDTGGQVGVVEHAPECRRDGDEQAGNEKGMHHAGGEE